MHSFLILLTLGLHAFANIDYHVFTEIWCINKTCYNLETASSQQEKTKGLMYRRTISPYRGMKFNWKTEEIRLMWMKNTYTSLDILWVNKNNIIVDIKENVPSNNTTIIKSNKKAQFIVELPSNAAKSNNIKIGQILTKSNF